MIDAAIAIMVLTYSLLILAEPIARIWESRNDPPEIC